MISVIEKHHLSKDRQWLPVVVACGLALLLFFALLDLWQIGFGQAAVALAQVFTDKENLLLLLTAATPFIFCGLAIVMAFRAGIYHLGAEAQFVGGMIMAIGVIENTIDYPHAWLLPAIILASAVGGSAIALVIGLLRRQTGLHEILSSAIMVIAARWLFAPAAKLIDPNQPLDDSLTAINMLLPDVFFGIFHYGFFYALMVGVMAMLLHRYHIIFFQLKLMGYGRHAMVETGQQEKKIYWFIMLVGGGLVGIGGAVALLDNWDGLQAGGDNLLPPLWVLTMGAVIVVYLGRMTPLGVVAISLLLGLVVATLKNLGIAIFDQGFFEIFCCLAFLLLLLIDFLYHYEIDMADMLQRARQESLSPDATKAMAKKRKLK
ncbi:MAG: hypothetical protein QM529_00100 [Hydrotalea sp.]|nr:hypothetical protein [Hydrotalea sp.]